MFTEFAAAVNEFSAIIGLIVIVGSVIYTAYKFATRGKA